MSSTEEKLDALTAVVTELTDMHRETLERIVGVEKTVQKSQYTPQPYSAFGQGYRYDPTADSGYGLPVGGDEEMYRELMTGSKTLLDELKGKSTVPPINLQRYNIKAWKDRALLGLSGEDHTEFYDITQFVDASAYQAAYGGSALPSELKINSKKVVDDPGLGLSKVSPTVWRQC